MRNTQIFYTMLKANILLVKDDITKIKVDAIVNAANSRLSGGGGVDGAIHLAAGPDLMKECRLLNGCATGSAKITKAYNLPSNYVIHAVGPVWRGGSSNEVELLKSCYITSLEIAKSKNLKSIAFPNISTGVYGFPKEKAAEIAVNAVRQFMINSNSLEKIYFVCFDDENFNLYKKLLN